MQQVIAVIGLFLALTTSALSSHVCNQHGAVVTMGDGTVLYLGKDCDAAREGGGTGTWWNAASFLGVQIDGQTYMVREEPICLPFCAS